MKTFFLILLFLISKPILANNIYKFKVIDAEHHMAEVDLILNNISDTSIEVKMPVWRSGRYEILNLSKNVRHFRAFDVKNNPLEWIKTNKNTWQINSNNAKTIHIKYQVYANQLKDRVSHIDSTHAFIDASGIFMFSEKYRTHPILIKLEVAKHWNSVSGLTRVNNHEFKADNFDQLVDSPIETGIHQYKSISVDNLTYEIVIWGDGNHDINIIAEDIKKLHYQAKSLWKSFPFKRYLYIIHAGDKLRGATEHVNSTVIQTDRFNFFPEKHYNKFINTVSHEFVHTWNVKAYRPAGITPYDYSTENYSTLFWMVEGSTSYFDSLLSVRAKTIKATAYFDKLSESIFNYLNKPGRSVMSLEQSSFDSWLKQDSHSNHNYSVNIYLKGSLVSWRLDMEIRKRSNNKKSLDDLHLLMYKNHNNKDKGYTKSDVLSLLKQLTKTDFNDFWLNYIYGTKEINFDELLNFYGLRFEPKPDGENTIEAWIGINTSDKDGFAQVISINKNSPAWQAGISTGDQIVAINGFKVTDDNIDSRIKQLSPTHQTKVSYFSNGILKHTQVKAIINPLKKAKIIPLKKVNSLQKRVFKDWLKQDIKTVFSK